MKYTIGIAVFVLLLIREQRFALVSLGLFGFGVALTGFLPSFWGLCLTTLIMSVGFHYYETMSQSLSLQWLAKAEAPRMLGRIVGASSFAAILGYALVYVLWKLAGMDFLALYLLAGGVTLLIAAGLWIAFPQFKEAVPQRKTLFLRRRYWLYYALVFMSGARRQIFVVFAGFLLVERFGFSVPAVAALYFLNQVLNTILAPYIGAMIGRFGERRVLITEYCGLVVIFAGYGLANSGLVAGSLYVADHVFFAMAIALTALIISCPKVISLNSIFVKENPRCFETSLISSRAVSSSSSLAFINCFSVLVQARLQMTPFRASTMIWLGFPALNKKISGWVILQIPKSFITTLRLSFVVYVCPTVTVCCLISAIRIKSVQELIAWSPGGSFSTIFPWRIFKPM